MKNKFKSTIILFVITAITPSLIFAGDGAISDELINKFREEFKMSPHNQAMYNAVTNNSISDLALNRDVLREHNELYTNKIKTKGITNQRSTGRCWAFAALNTMRPAVIKKYRLEKFEFAQNYMAFWDKLEKANLFLERVIELRDRDPLDRDLTRILKSPCPDGGDWEYAIHLIKKYGIVPKEIMPETNSSEKTGAMTGLLNVKLRKDAVKLRQMHQDGKTVSDMRAEKKKMLTEVYKILVVNLGSPPTQFDWRYEYKADNSDDDDDDEDLLVSELKTYTPKTFYEEFVGVDLDEYLDLFNDPAKEFNKLYQGRMSKSAQDNPDITYANIGIHTMKQIVLKSLLDDHPVWFGADVGKDQSRSHGIMAINLYDYDSMFNIDMKMTKAEKRLFRQTSRNHAMVFLGVDLQEEKPVKWLVENSWGESRGSEGFWAMYDSWFDEYVFNIVVHKKYVPEDVLKIFEQTPTILEPWDSMLMD
jgi:bleomycin hydrolase